MSPLPTSHSQRRSSRAGTRGLSEQLMGERSGLGEVACAADRPAVRTRSRV